MLKHVTFWGAAALACAASGSAFAQDTAEESVEVTADTVVARVGETEITIGELIVAKRQLPPQYTQFPDEVLFDGLVDQLIQQQLLSDQLEEVPAEVKYTISNETRALMAAEVITEIAETSVTEDMIRAAYEERFAEVEEVTEFNASHLLVETEEEALAAKARIDEGAAFADVARDVSTGPTGPNGGNLGWFGPGAMVPEFEEAVAALEIGGVTDPFETQFGWHVATLNEKRAQAQPSYEDMRRQLTAELQEAAVTARLEELAADQVVVEPEEGQFDPSVINMVELLDQ